MSEMNSKNFRKLPAQQLQELIGTFIEIELIESFQIIRETLGRMGIIKQNVLYQTAHILSKKGTYYILHFKQLFALDGRENTLNDEDILRLYKIIKMLIDWNLIRLVDSNNAEKINSSNCFVSIAKVQDVRDNNIILKKKYNI